MAFDGIGYVDSAPVYPSRHVPHAAAVGQAYGDVLRIANMWPRNSGRLVISQHTALNLRAPDAALAAIQTANTTYASIAEGYRFISPEVTHLRASIKFSVHATQATSAYHRVVIVQAGGGTDTGAATETFIEAPVQVARMRRLHFFPLEAVYEARCEVALANVSTNGVRRIYIEAYARDRSGGPARLYAALYSRVWTEIR